MQKPKKCKIGNILGYFYTLEQHKLAVDNEEIVNQVIDRATSETISTQETSIPEGEFI